MRTPSRGSSARKSGLRLAGAAACLFLLSSNGCTSPDAQSDPQVFTWQGALRAPGTVHVRNLNGSIEVLPATDSVVRVTAAARWRRGNPRLDIDYQVATDSNQVAICANWGHGQCTAGGKYSSSPSFLSRFFRRGTDASIAFTVYVPSRIAIDAVTLNGNVTVTATAPVKARTVNGSVRVATAVGPVDAETINGSVDARMTTLSGAGAVRAKTVNGTAAAYVPESLDATYDVQVANGSIGGDFGIGAVGLDQKTRRARGSLGAGGRIIQVHSINGRAELRALKADGTVAGAAVQPSR